METVLSIRNVVKTFGPVRAVDGLSFDVRSGTITGLLGRNGAGKTTTLRMITGVFLPDAGSISLLGSTNGASRARDRVGYLPEERGLYRKMKVLEQLLFFAEIKDRRPAEAKRSAEHWLRRFDLWESRDRKLEELSKGNQQKIQIIGAMLHDPELLIFDEPMSGLDPVNVVLVREMLRELRAEGRTILLSTHMMGEAERVVDDIVLIHNGKVVVAGALDGVRSAEGSNSVHLSFEGDGAFLEALPGVSRCVVQKRAAELRLAPGTDPQSVLAAAFPTLRIQRFEVAAPSLEDIFIEKVGGVPAKAEEPAP